MELLKAFWENLLVVWVVVASWIFFISGGISLMLLFFLWAFRIGKIFQIHPAMGFDNFFHLLRMEILLVMTLVGFLGVYFLYWKKLRKILKLIN